MTTIEPPTASETVQFPHWIHRVAAFILIAYAALLARGITQPWTGLHDWNGAFYSQLARNLLRYPFDMHHGMPVIAVGQAVPAEGEWSFYATHPPGLVWCIAASFQVFGVSEWAARLVPLLCSLATLALLHHAVARRYGASTANLTAVIYALLPMAAFFGRSPDQEAPCLFLMLAAALAADRMLDPPAGKAPRLRPGFVWSVAIFAAIWVDWVSIILAGLVLLRGLIATVHGRMSPAAWARLATAPILAIVLLVFYIVFFGLGGQWSDLFAIFTSRAGASSIASQAAPPSITALANTLENITWPVVGLAVIGGTIQLFARIRHRPSPSPRRQPNGLSLVGLTGIIWVALFWRLFLIHQYWLFYLGPTIALFAAMGLLSIHRTLSQWRPSAATVTTSAIAIIATGFLIHGVNVLFERVRVPLAETQAWQFAGNEIKRHLSPESEWEAPPPPVLMTRDPLKIEMRGQYRLRNILPPHFAYYFDYPFEVELDLERALAKLPSRAGLLIHGSEAQHHWPRLQGLQGTVEFHTFGNWQLLRPIPAIAPN